ncbi:MAG: hypothetical protein RL557_907 [archaeon]|jgi:hypothetical protein
MGLDIPCGLVYGNKIDGTTKIIYHLVLATDPQSDSYAEEMMYVHRSGTLVVNHTRHARSIAGFFEQLADQKIFLLSDHQFSDFRNFYDNRRDTNFSRSQFYDKYPPSSRLVQTATL